MNKHVVKFVHTGIVLDSAKPTKSKTVPTVHVKGGKNNLLLYMKFNYMYAFTRNIKFTCMLLRETSNLHVCFYEKHQTYVHVCFYEKDQTYMYAFRGR